jgi:hypothetical protein
MRQGPTGNDLYLPTGREVRRWTRRQGSHHSESTLSDSMGDLYTGALAVLMGAFMTFSLASSLADRASAQRGGGAGPGLDTGWLVVLPAVAVTAALVDLAARLGPVSLPAAQATWWLPMPVDRRTLLRPAALGWLIASTLFGVIEGTAIALAKGTAAGLLATTAVLGAAATVILIAFTGLVQHRPATHRAVQMAADVVVALTPIGGIVFALTGWASPDPGDSLFWVSLAMVATACALTPAWDRRLGRIPGASLRSRGAIADEALVAVLSLDPRGLGRALADRSEPAQRRRSATLSWLTRIPARWRPMTTLVVSDLLLLVRTPRHLAQAGISACLPALALLVPEPDAGAVCVTVLIGAYTGALGTAEGARRAHANPSLDAILPLGQRQARAARLVVPAVTMLLWWAPVGGLLAWRYDSAGWIVLGGLCAPLWAAAVVRAAYRPVPDFTGPQIDTPMGTLPPGLSAVATQGPDFAILGSSPVMAAVILGVVPPTLLVLQLVLSLAAIAFMTRPPSRAA